MELREFVKTALTEVVTAVNECDKELSKRMFLSSNQNNRTIGFDIAVTVDDAARSSGKAGVKIFQFLEGSSEVSKEAHNSSVSRIRFGVHINPNDQSQSWTPSTQAPGSRPGAHF